MKIIQIVPAFRLAGAEVMCENLCCAIKETGNEVIAVSLYSEETAITDRLRNHGVKIYYLDKKPGIDFTIFRKLYSIFKREKPDVVHTHIYASKYALPIAKLAKVRACVHTVHNVAGEEQSKIGALINGFLFKVKAVTPVALSKEIQRTVVQEYKVSNDIVPIVFNGIDLSKYKKKTKYDIEDGFSILHIGRFMEVKNHRLMVEAMKILVESNNKITLSFIGEGPLFDDIQKLVVENQLTNNVRLLGLKGNVAPFLTDADLFILPSSFEGMPMTLIEAMASGVPIIASNVGGIPDMLEDKKEALLIPCDKEDLVNCIISLYNSKSLREYLGNNAYCKSTAFSSMEMATSYISIYKRLLAH